MNELDIKIHNKHLISIKNLTHDLLIGEKKWNNLIKNILEETEVVYFNGFRLNYIDEDFEDTINYLDEHILFDDEKKHFRLLFRMKIANLMFSENLINKLWDYYEYPSFIFLKEGSQENTLLNIFEKSHYHNDFIKHLSGIYILYRSLEQDVLWIESDQNLIHFTNSLNI